MSERMVHDGIKDLLDAYAAGSLDGTARDLADRHLVGCVACRDELAATMALRDAVRRADDPPPARVTELTEVWARIEAAEGAAGPARHATGRWWPSPRRAWQRPVRAPTRGGGTGRRRGLLRRPLVLVPAAALLALALGATAQALRERSPANPLEIGCATALERGWSGTSLTFTPGMDPVAACEAEWRASGRPEPAGTAVCVLPDQIATVFPTPGGMSQADACASIGAAVPAAGAYGGAGEDAVRAFDDDLRRRLLALPGVPGCWSWELARPAVSDALASGGLTGWTLDDTTTPADRAHVDVVVLVREARVEIRPADRAC